MVTMTVDQAFSLRGGASAGGRRGPDSRAVAGLPPGQGACFKCGQHGHWGSDCPNPPPGVHGNYQARRPGY